MNDVNDFLDELTEMLEDPKYLFAHETLSGIKTTVEKSSRVTEGQRRAVSNISRGTLRSHAEEDPSLPSKRRDEGSNRRYEGWNK